MRSHGRTCPDTGLSKGGRAIAVADEGSQSNSSCSSDASSVPGSEDEMSYSTPAAAEMGQLDLSEVPWDEAESFALRKYPSYEIDWDSLLAD